MFGIHLEVGFSDFSRFLKYARRLLRNDSQPAMRSLKPNEIKCKIIKIHSSFSIAEKPFIVKCGYNLICLFWSRVGPSNGAVITAYKGRWASVYVDRSWLLWKGMWWGQLNTFCVLSPALSPLRLLFFFSSVFLVSDKIFATAIPKDVNYTPFNNLGSWSGEESALSFHPSYLKGRV